eukprot:365911-Chlamydomonas_euryale.AAC.7
MLTVAAASAAFSRSSRAEWLTGGSCAIFAVTAMHACRDGQSASNQKGQAHMKGKGCASASHPGHPHPACRSHVKGKGCARWWLVVWTSASRPGHPHPACWSSTCHCSDQACAPTPAGSASMVKTVPQPTTIPLHPSWCALGPAKCGRLRVFSPSLMVCSRTSLPAPKLSWTPPPGALSNCAMQHALGPPSWRGSCVPAALPVRPRCAPSASPLRAQCVPAALPVRPRYPHVALCCIPATPRYAPAALLPPSCPALAAFPLPSRYAPAALPLRSPPLIP